MPREPLYMQEEVDDVGGFKFIRVKEELVRLGYAYIPPANTESVEYNFVKPDAHMETIDMWDHEGAVGTAVLVTIAYRRGQPRWTLRVVGIGGHDHHAVSLYKRLTARVKE